MVVKQGHRPAQERARADADGRQDHRLEPDAEQPLHVIRRRSFPSGQSRYRSLSAMPRYCVGLKQRISIRSAPPEPARIQAGSSTLVGVVLLDREDVALEFPAGPGVDRLDLGVDRLADLALGRPVDVEGHLDGDRRRVQRGGLAAQPRASSALPADSALAALASSSVGAFDQGVVLDRELVPAPPGCGRWPRRARATLAAATLGCSFACLALSICASSS